MAPYRRKCLHRLVAPEGEDIRENLRYGQLLVESLHPDRPRLRSLEHTLRLTRRTRQARAELQGRSRSKRLCAVDTRTWRGYRQPVQRTDAQRAARTANYIQRAAARKALRIVLSPHSAALAPRSSLLQDPHGLCAENFATDVRLANDKSLPARALVPLEN